MVKVSTEITVTIGKKIVKMSMEEARELHIQLGVIVGAQQAPIIPWTVPANPWTPLPDPLPTYGDPPVITTTPRTTDWSW